MNKLITLSLILCSGLAHSTSFFDNLNSVPATIETIPVFCYETSGCNFAESPNLYVEYDNGFGPASQKCRDTTFDSSSFVHSEFSVSQTGNVWQGKFSCSFTTRQYVGSDLIDTFSQTKTITPAAANKTEQACTDLTFTFENNGACYSPIDMELNDSCDAGNFFPTYGNTAQTACAIMQDGSACTVISDSSGQWYDVQEGSCYSNNGDLPTVTPTQQPPTENTCVPDSNGMLMCSFTGDQTNGYDDNKTCGTYNIGSGSVSVCYDTDTNGNGIPDHQDPDIDGDGIPNIDDPDANGNGIPDIDEGYGTGSSGGSGGGGSGTGDTTQFDDSRIVQRLDAINDRFQNGTDPTQGYLNDAQNQITAANDAQDEFINKTPSELGFTALDNANLTSVQDAFSGITADCVNPVLHGQTVDLCSKSTMINTWLTWITSFLTLIFVYREVTDTIKGQN